MIGIDKKGNIPILTIILAFFAVVGVLAMVSSFTGQKPVQQLCKDTLGNVVPCSAIPFEAGGTGGQITVPATGGTTVVVQEKCGLSPTLTLTGFNYVNRGTKISDLNYTLYKKGKSDIAYSLVGTFSSGTATSNTLSEGDAIIAYFNSGSTANTYNPRKIASGENTWDTQLSGEVKTLGTAPCSGNWVVETLIETQGDAFIRFFNTDDGLINATGDKQAVGTGQTVNFKVTVDENKDNGYFGSQYAENPILMVVDGNENAFTAASFKPTIVYVSSDKPNGWVKLTGDTNYTGTWAYKLTGLPYLKEFESKEFKISVEAKSGVDPADDPTDLEPYARISLLAPRLTQRDDGTWRWDYRDVDDATALAPAYSTKWFYS